MLFILYTPLYRNNTDLEIKYYLPYWTKTNNFQQFDSVKCHEIIDKRTSIVFSHLTEYNCCKLLLLLLKKGILFLFWYYTYTTTRLITYINISIL